MFELPLTPDAVVEMLERVRVPSMPTNATTGALTDTDRITMLALLEELKGAAAAAQSTLAVDFERSQRVLAQQRGVPARRLGEGIVEQVALARRESPARAAQLMTLARSLHQDLPRTRAALTAGQISEYRAQVVARETSHLSPVLRHQVDAELGAREGGIGQWGNRQLAAETRRIAYRLDPHGAVRRRARAKADRRVWVKPAPDTMAQLSALLDVKDGVRAYATLRRDAQALQGGGDQRSLDQLMADLYVARLTGDDDSATGSVTVNVVMTDQALLGDSETVGHDEPAVVHGLGVVPAAVARSIVREAHRAWVRRLFVSPETGEVIATDSRRRLFDGALRDLLVTLDEVCRTPWCDAPVRHLDHVVRHAAGGTTTFGNAQGLCERCNYAKESGFLEALPADPRTSDVITITQTGHSYRSRRTRPPLAPPVGATVLEVEAWLSTHTLVWEPTSDPPPT